MVQHLVVTLYAIAISTAALDVLKDEQLVKTVRTLRFIFIKSVATTLNILVLKKLEVVTIGIELNTDAAPINN